MHPYLGPCLRRGDGQESRGFRKGSFWASEGQSGHSAFQGSKIMYLSLLRANPTRVLSSPSHEIWSSPLGA
jgi:hypothetical protein